MVFSILIDLCNYIKSPHQPKRNSTPFSSYSSLPNPPGAWQSLVYFQSLSVDLPILDFWYKDSIFILFIGCAQSPLMWEAFSSCFNCGLRVNVYKLEGVSSTFPSCYLVLNKQQILSPSYPFPEKRVSNHYSRGVFMAQVVMLFSFPLTSIWLVDAGQCCYSLQNFYN